MVTLDYGLGYYGKRSADAEPEAKADADPYYYGGYGLGYAGYGGYGLGYARYGGYGHLGYGLGYYGKRSADAEPEAKAAADPYYYGGYGLGYAGYGGYGLGYARYGYGHLGYAGYHGFGYYGKRSADAEPEAKADADPYYYGGYHGLGYAGYGGYGLGYSRLGYRLHGYGHGYGYGYWG